MAGRITGPYRGFFINASAAPSGNGAPHYVGAISLTEHGVDEPRKREHLVEMGDVKDYADDMAALEHLEAMARNYIDELLSADSFAPTRL